MFSWLFPTWTWFIDVPSVYLLVKFCRNPLRIQLPTVCTASSKLVGVEADRRRPRMRIHGPRPSRDAFRARMRSQLNHHVDTNEVELTLERWQSDSSSHSGWLGFFACISFLRHAYRWGVTPVVSGAQNESLVTFSSELDLPWIALQQHFGITSPNSERPDAARDALQAAIEILKMALKYFSVVPTMNVKAETINFNQAYVQGFQGWALDGIDGISGQAFTKERGYDELTAELELDLLVKQLRLWRMGHMRRMQPYESVYRPERLHMTAGISVVDASDEDNMIEHLKKELGNRLSQTV
ncbi:hypothetical protein DFH09DRAFT_1072682 [Mycena vulgaris]|nr:hypothetical protein DFH09DRAFT_1072682 [Mycena vulgaris]